MPASNITPTRSHAIPLEAVACVIAFDVMVTQAVLPPSPSRRNGESAGMSPRRIRAPGRRRPALFLEQGRFPVIRRHGALGGEKEPCRRCAMTSCIRFC